MKQKPKRRSKGKKLYRNTHGNWFRVRSSYKLRRKIKHRKLLWELKKQKKKSKLANPSRRFP